ncbi:catabolite control protein A [Paenibacillus darwinianus]|uniref:Catabolite control protein A n=1 Tax=Paenibacillus darwinianus TaxID=1380763 RepID=A0A9W5W6Z8_9BACL|nr:substrate-binding domain-containing protein [Paenibacillus darwinianus]EXX87775.1 catabolite control protein A [Paenibacillus darwinianus]EXX88149.1 catabolite control protein A [Paenibacillus darwinianus]EXX89029.1 catabolite control protein A [Paenibacillus darwinianus]
MKPTIRDVAKHAGVSISTVSRVMNAPETVVEDKRSRVLEAIGALQYQPNGFARGLIYKKSDTLGVMIPDIENPYYAGLIRGMQDAAVRLNHSLMICNTDRDHDRLLSYIHSFYEKQVDGIIFASDAMHEDYYEEMLRHRLPFVLASTNAPQFDIPSVDIDDEQAACDAVRHLIENGHKAIGMISFPLGDTISGYPRFDGFQRALREHGQQAYETCVEFAAHRFEDAYAAAVRLLAAHPELTAIFAASDEFAMGAISCVRDSGRSVPEDVSVVGFDNIRMAHMFIPKLTTVAQPVYEIGYRAVCKLHELAMTGEVKELREKLPHKLIIRESTRTL